MITISNITESTSKSTRVGAFRPWRGIVFLPALFCIGGTIGAAEVNKPAPNAEPDESKIKASLHSGTIPSDVTNVTGATQPQEITDADLQNLSACARMVMKDLTPEQMQAVAVAIKHAEDDVQAMRKAKAVPVEVKDEKKP